MNLNFDPLKDGKPYVSKDPFTTAMRFIRASLFLLLSSRPQNYFIWLKSLLLRHRPLSYPLPWITFPAIEKIHELIDLSSRTKILEFGAGNSTFYWSSFGCDVNTIEADPNWYSLMTKKIKSENIENIKILLAKDEKEWIAKISEFGVLKYDMIVVDGGPRPNCVEAAINYLKPGGVLVIDNTDWHWWNKPIQLVPSDWSQIPLKGYVPMNLNQNETTICISPLNE